MSVRTVPTICRICKENCGLLVSRGPDGVSVAGNPEHPVSRGFICRRGRAAVEVHDHPERLRTPLLRRGDDFVPIGLDEALNLLAGKIMETATRHGPRAVGLYKGESLKHQEVAGYLKHLAYGLGTPNYLSVGSLCHRAMAMGHGMTYGGIPHPDYDRARSALIWGANPAASSQRGYAELRRAAKNGLKVVVVDPSRTTTAAAADCHLAVTPGADGYLALAFLAQAVDAGLAPEPDGAEGFAELKALALVQDRAALLERAGIASEDFARAWALLFENRPVFVQTGLGLELKPSGVQAIRAVACLGALLDGERPASHAARLSPLPGAGSYPPRVPAIGAAEAPYFTGGDKEGQAMHWGRAIREGRPYPLRTMLVMGGNPMLTFPDTENQRQALSALDFLAVFDLFLTPTARLAHLVLPATDFLDSLELHDYGLSGRPLLGLVRPTTQEPVGHAPWEIIFGLAGRLGLGHLFPWKDNREAIAARLTGSGVSFDDLWCSPTSTASYAGPGKRSERTYFASPTMAKLGQPALPEPDCFALPEYPGEEFPFYLSTGDRLPAFQHSQQRNCASCRETVPGPRLDIHPEAAAPLGIADGQLVRLETRNGAVELAARLTDEVRPDCLRLTHGWEEANANALTGLAHFDPVSGFPWLSALPARLAKA